MASSHGASSFLGGLNYISRGKKQQGILGEEALLDGFISADGKLLYAWKINGQGDVLLESPRYTLSTVYNHLCVGNYIFDVAGRLSHNLTIQVTHKSSNQNQALWFMKDNIFSCSVPPNSFLVVFLSMPWCSECHLWEPSDFLCYFHKPGYWIIEWGKCLTCFYKFLAVLLWSATVCWAWKKHTIALLDNDVFP